jgi:FKBP-type peptidyl-prolyl cis-trans isomerase FklB
MKSALIGVLAALFLATQAFAAEEGPLKTQKDKASYAIGANLGKSMNQQSVDIDLDLFLMGLKDGLAGQKSLLTDQEIREVMTAFTKELQAKQAEKMKALGEKNKKEGEVFLAENKTKEGVKTLPDGLQYKVIQEGTGAMPKATDTVTVNYRGTLIDGTEFDSSYKRGQPATFPVKGVVPGWTEALQMMKVGSKWQLFLPASLAYGDRSAGPTIGPNAVLVFDVELVAIKEPAKEPAKPQGKGPAKQPAKAGEKQAPKDGVKEPAKAPAKEPAKEAPKQPGK